MDVFAADVHATTAPSPKSTKRRSGLLSSAKTVEKEKAKAEAAAAEAAKLNTSVAVYEVSNGEVSLFLVCRNRTSITDAWSA